MRPQQDHSIDVESGILNFFLDIRYLRIVFVVLFTAVQILDGISTVLALKSNVTHYEANPLLSMFLSLNGNIILTVMAYQIVTLIIVLGMVLLIDLRNELYWKSKVVRFLLCEAYITGTILLVILRLIFAVIPNFVLFLKYA